MKTVTIMLTVETAERAKSLLEEALPPQQIETDSIHHALKTALESPGQTIVEQRYNEKAGWIGLG